MQKTLRCVVLGGTQCRALALGTSFVSHANAFPQKRNTKYKYTSIKHKYKYKSPCYFCFCTTYKHCQRHNGPRVLSLNLIYLCSLNEFKFNSVENIIQFKDSIPWVRCASGHVFSTFSFFSTFFPSFFSHFF